MNRDTARQQTRNSKKSLAEQERKKMAKYHDMSSTTETPIENTDTPIDIITRAVQEATAAQKRMAAQLEQLRRESNASKAEAEAWRAKHADVTSALATWKQERVSQEGHIAGLQYPVSDPTFVMAGKLDQLFAAVHAESTAGHPPNVLLTGPQGCGKTSTGFEFAARHGLPVLKMNCQLIREPRDWFGAKTATDGNIHWETSQFVRVVQRGGVVIILDEITRATPAVLNALMPLLDHTRAAFLEEVKEILEVGPDVYWFGTANIGAQFTGAFGMIDAALADRFEIQIPCTYLKADAEVNLLQERTGIAPDVATKLVKVANDVRRENDMGGKLSETISTRMLLAAGKLYRRMGVGAFEYTLLPKFSSENGKNSEQSHVLQLLQGQFGSSIAAMS